MIAKTIAANASIQTLTFLTGILAAYVLGAEGRGELALVLLYPQLLANFVLLGVDRATSVLAGQGKLRRPFDLICVVALGGAATVMVTAWICIDFLIGDRRLAALADIYTLYIPAVYFYLLAISYFSGAGDFGKYNVARILFYVLYPLLVVVLLAFPIPSLSVFVVSNLIGTYGAFVIALLFMLRVRHRQDAWSWGAVAFDLKLLSRKALIFVVPAGVSVACTYLPQLILGNLNDIRGLGLFVVYLSYSRLATVFAGAFNVKVFHLSITGNDPNFPGHFRAAFLIHLVYALLLCLAAPTAINLFYGRDFDAEMRVAQVLLLSAIFFYLSEMLNERFRGRSMLKPEILSLAIYFTVTLTFAARLVPAYGLLGMAIAVVVGDAARLVVLVWMTHRIGGLRPGDLFMIRTSDFRTILGRVIPSLR